MKNAININNFSNVDSYDFGSLTDGNDVIVYTMEEYLSHLVGKKDVSKLMSIIKEMHIAQHIDADEE